MYLSVIPWAQKPDLFWGAHSRVVDRGLREDLSGKCQSLESDGKQVFCLFKCLTTGLFVSCAKCILKIQCFILRFPIIFDFPTDCKRHKGNETGNNTFYKVQLNLPMVINRQEINNSARTLSVNGGKRQCGEG